MYLPSKTEDLLAQPRPVDAPGAVLLKAAQLIREKGLAKGDFHDYEGRFCVHGAINQVALGEPSVFRGERDNPVWEEATSRLTNFVYNTRPPREFDYMPEPGWAAAWNNQDARTAEEVIAALEAAAYT